jgi:TRAP-type C4-dicarboxylate transport system permease small subunit
MTRPRTSERRRWGLDEAWDRLQVTISDLLAILVAAMALAVVFEVIMRYFFNRPTSWAVDFTEYAMVYLTFFGAAWLVRERSHIKVDMLTSQLKPRTQLMLELVLSIFAAATLAVLVWKGVEHVWEAYVNNQAMLKSWVVPRWILLLPIPLGGLLMLLEVIRQTREGLEALRTGRVTEAHRVVEGTEAEVEEARGL